MRTVFKYYKSYIPLIVGILAFLFGQAMCELALPGYMSDIINDGIVKGDMDYIRKIRPDHDPGILRQRGMLVSSAVAGQQDWRPELLLSRRGIPATRCSTKSRIVFSSGTVEQFSTASLITRSTNDVQMVQQTTVHDPETRLLRADHGHRSRHQSALRTQAFPLSWTDRRGAGWSSWSSWS